MQMAARGRQCLYNLRLLAEFLRESVVGGTSLNLQDLRNPVEEEKNKENLRPFRKKKEEIWEVSKKKTNRIFLSKLILK